MGEARRRKLAGNTTPDKQWHDRKAADKHSKKVMREMQIRMSESPMQMAMLLPFLARRGLRK